MTRADLIIEVSRIAEITRKEAKVIVEILLESIVETLRAGGNVQIRGFGSFRTRKRSGRIGRNPKTAEQVRLPPRAIAFFKPSKEVLELINRSRPN